MNIPIASGSDILDKSMWRALPAGLGGRRRDMPGGTEKGTGAQRRGSVLVTGWGNQTVNRCLSTQTCSVSVHRTAACICVGLCLTNRVRPKIRKRTLHCLQRSPQMIPGIGSQGRHTYCVYSFYRQLSFRLFTVNRELRFSGNASRPA